MFLYAYPRVPQLCASKPCHKQPPKCRWTIMVKLAGDNTRGYYDYYDRWQAGVWVSQGVAQQGRAANNEAHAGGTWKNRTLPEEYFWRSHTLGCCRGLVNQRLYKQIATTFDGSLDLRPRYEVSWLQAIRLFVRFIKNLWWGIKCTLSRYNNDRVLRSIPTDIKSQGRESFEARVRSPANRRRTSANSSYDPLCLSVSSSIGISAAGTTPTFYNA